MMTLLDSPLNKAGLMKLYVHTQTNVLIDVNPKIRIPRTFKRFSGLMGMPHLPSLLSSLVPQHTYTYVRILTMILVQLLHKLSIKAEGVRGEPVLKLVKGSCLEVLPSKRYCHRYPLLLPSPFVFLFLTFHTHLYTFQEHLFHPRT